MKGQDSPVPPPLKVRIKAWVGLAVMMIFMDIIWWSATGNHMGWLQNLFGSGKKTSAEEASAASSSTPSDNDMITVYDAYGREMQIRKKDWWDSVLAGNLEKAWNQPNELAGLIISGLQDGFAAHLEKAARQLQETDPDPSRGSVLLAIVYLETGRPLLAENLLTTYLAKHGQNGVVLTNLAKAFEAQGQHTKAMGILRQGLQLDPNQDNGLAWYWANAREEQGEEKALELLRGIAGIDGSWRAQLWLARERLEHKDLAGALALYRESLKAAGDPVPVDLLQHVSGDLGNQGHLLELLELTAPRYDLTAHGLMIGNNLLKAYTDLGQLEPARKLLRELQGQQRPDWKPHLAFWEGELQRLVLESAPPIRQEELIPTALTIPGPLWLPAASAVSRHFPQKESDALHIAFVGSSYESPIQPTKAETQPTDKYGRFTRALPLFLSEQVFQRSPARTTTLQHYILNNGGGFLLAGQAFDDADLARLARESTSNQAELRAVDYLIASHLKVQGENWTLRLRLIRTIDAARLAEKEFALAEGVFRDVADGVLAWLAAVLSEQAGLNLGRAQLPVLPGELDHYLFRLEQTLAVRCTTLPDASYETLSNPAEILDGLVYLSLQSPEHAPPRLLLWRALDGIRKVDPDLANSLKPKLDALMNEHPLPDKSLQADVVKALAEEGP